MLVIAALAYYFFFVMPPSEQPLEEQYSKLSSLWEEQGLSGQPLIFQAETLAEMDKAELQSLKKNIVLNKGSLSGEIADLADVYVAYLETIPPLQDMEAAGALLEGAEETCEIYRAYSALAGKTAAFSDAVEAYNAKVAAFVEKYPLDSVSLAVSVYDNGELKAGAAELMATAESFEGMC